MAGRDEPPSCVPQGRGVAPRASRFLAYGKSGSSVPAAGREHANMHGKPTLSARLAAGRSCPFLGLAAGAASPTPPGRGLCPLPTPLRGALPPRPPNGGKCPPLPPLTGRLRDRTGQAGPWPGRTSRPLAYGKGGGCTPGRPLSCLRQERKFRSCSWAGTRRCEEMTHRSARQTAGRSCPFSGLAAGEVFPSPLSGGPLQREKILPRP